MSTAAALPFSDIFARDLQRLSVDGQVAIAMVVWLSAHRRGSFDAMAQQYLATPAQQDAYRRKAAARRWADRVDAVAAVPIDPPADTRLRLRP